MKKVILATFAAALLMVAVITGTGCNKESKSLTATKHATPKLPAYTDYVNVNTANGNINLSGLSNGELTNASIELGRVLFYDTRLSINNRISCASCHQQNLGFADNASFSVGFGGKITGRNANAIINPIIKKGLFWDIRAKDALELSLMPVFNHIEMGMESDEMLVQKIAAEDFYKSLFQKAFNTENPSRELISKAIAHFVNSIYTENSKFDNAERNQGSYTALEQVGRDIFFSDRAKCSNCHGGRNLSEPTPPYYGEVEFQNTANIGLDEAYTDNGFNNGQFRVPSLRNIELTAPYMHDGRFKTLEQVIDHYSNGIKNHPNLDRTFKTAGGPIRMNFTETEKLALVAFLKTFTDASLLKDTRYSDPFVYN